MQMADEQHVMLRQTLKPSHFGRTGARASSLLPFLDVCPHVWQNMGLNRPPGQESAPVR